MKQTKPTYTGFTLIELLVTVGIIAILAGLLLPMVIRSTKQTVKRTVQLEAVGIKKAVDVFYATYNRPPITFGENPAASRDDTTLTEAFDPAHTRPIIQALIGNDDDHSRKVNPQRKPFLAMVPKPDCVEGADITKGRFYDAWCNEFGIMLDRDGDGKIQYQGLTYLTRCIAISKGPDGVSGVAGGDADDISSVSR